MALYEKISKMLSDVEEEYQTTYFMIENIEDYLEGMSSEEQNEYYDSLKVQLAILDGKKSVLNSLLVDAMLDTL